MYPSLWFAPLRKVSADTSLGPHRLEAGTVVAYSPYLLGRRPDTFAEPHKFSPDRWNGVKLPISAHPVYTPFGGGARKCIASDLSFTELVLVLATIARRWRLQEVADGGPLPTRAGVGNRRPTSHESWLI
jgi:cytochrome P450